MTKLTKHEAELLVGAVDVAKELRDAENEQHRHLGNILAGVCTLAAKLAGDLSVIRPLVK